jgi:GntR family transcriptional regulator
MKIMKRAIEKRPDVPLYTQVSTIIRGQIDDGELRRGDRLQSEPELAEEYAVSRATVRQALDELERDGLIERVVGRGTFVLQASAQKRTERERLTFNDLQKRFAKSSQVILNSGKAATPPIVESSLNIQRGEHCTFSIRVLKSGRTTWGAVKHYVHPVYVPVLQKVLEEPLPIMEQLPPALRKSAQTTDVWYEAIIAEPRFAMMLKVPLGSPILSVWWTCSFEGRPALCSQMILPGSQFSIIGA